MNLSRSFSTAEAAMAGVQSGARVFAHGMAATPEALLAALTARAAELRDVEIIHLHTEGPAAYAALPESFRVNCLFIGANVRPHLQGGAADYIPVFLSEIPALFRSERLPIDVALVQVSPPDKHGYCSLGVSVDVALAAVEMAEHVVAEVNPHMPRTHGDGLISLSKIDALVWNEAPLPENLIPPPDEAQQAIGRNVAALVEDGATLQMGIGAIPNAVLSCLGNHKDLGVHTEMFSDGVIDLVERGAITGARKKLNPGILAAGFVMGTKRLYDFVDDNPAVQLFDIGYVNDVANICQNPKVVAVNSAIEIDLTGQVCADSIGERMYSGVGGQMDFIRGASLSEGGKPVIALPSRSGKGAPRIVPTLRQGAGVVTTRAHVHHVVTEFGAADLYGKNLRQRARALIQLAHPDDREALERAAFQRFGRL